MTAADDINTQLASIMLGPEEVTVGSERVKQRSAKDLIDAAAHLAGEESTTQPHLGLRFTRLISPAAWSE